MHEQASITTFLFTDIEGSTRLWEQDPERMRPALARHDAIARSAVEGHRGVIVKMTGDGVHAAFSDPLDAVHATLQIQEALADPAHTEGFAFSWQKMRQRLGLEARFPRNHLSSAEIEGEFRRVGLGIRGFARVGGMFSRSWIVLAEAPSPDWLKD